jgi:hypothetical protein
LALDPTANFLFADNQDTDTAVTFRVNQRNGRLTPTGQIVKVDDCLHWCIRGSPVTGARRSNNVPDAPRARWCCRWGGIQFSEWRVPELVALAAVAAIR